MIIDIDLLIKQKHTSEYHYCIEDVPEATLKESLDTQQPDSAEKVKKYYNIEQAFNEYEEGLLTNLESHYQGRQDK